MKTLLCVTGITAGLLLLLFGLIVVIILIGGKDLDE